MDVVLLTATWRQDFDRFRLLRRSLREFGLDESFRHIVAVHTEDTDLLTDLRRDRNLEIVPTSRLLTKRIERRRAAAHFRRTRRQHWVVGGPVAGWYAQQLTKMALVSLAADSQAAVFLDSDLVAIRPFDRDDFIASSGATRFFVSNDMRDDGSEGWNCVSARLLGVDEELVQHRQFIQLPTVFDVRVATALVHALGSEDHPSSWQARMLAANAFEYPTYGAWITRAQPTTVETCPPMNTLNFSEYSHMWDFKDRAVHEIHEGTAKFLSVQSRLHIPPESYEPIVAEAWH